MVLTREGSPRDPDKFPAAQLFLLALVRVAEPIAITSIFPYAWKLVLHFEIGDRSNASFYAGILIAAFALAEACTSVFWGALSDRLGRKPVVLMGCCGTIVSLLSVGLSTNFWIALLGRALGGALNGNVGVIQTMVGEMITNPEHEPKAYAVMPFVWSVGTIIGPSIGGLFSEPAKNFPGHFSPNGIFAKFPYLLPNLICSALMVTSIIAAWIFMAETHPDKQPSRAPDVPHRPSMSTGRPLFPAQPTSTGAGANIEHESYGTFNHIEESAVEEDWNVTADGTSRESHASGKTFTKRVILLTVALGIFTYHSMTYDHLLPIFFQDERVPPDGTHMLDNSFTPGSLAGGLGLSTKDVGVIMTVQGLIALFIQAVVFPLMASYLGIWRTFIVVTVAHPVAYFIVPWLVYLPQNLLYPGIYACLAVRNLTSIVAYPILLILIKEASPAPNCLGKINGLAASTGAACRTMAAPIAGFLYGVGIQIDLTALAWWASTVVALAGAVQAFFINQRKTGPQHEVHVAAPFQFMENEHRHRHTRHSIIHIHVGEERGNDDTDERTPLRPTRSAIH